MNQPLICTDGADLNLLHITAGIDSDKRDEVLQFLLKKEDINVDAPSGPGNDHWTAAHIAASWGFDHTLDILIKHSADPLLPDMNGWNVWDIANRYDNFQCVLVLRKRLHRLNDETIVIDDDDEDDDKNDDRMISMMSNHSANEMIHIDKKFGVAFIEEKAADPVADVSQPEPPVDESICALDDTHLRRLLIQNGESPGPIVGTTRQFYRRRLQRLQSAVASTPPQSPLAGGDCTVPQSMPLAGYSAELNSLISGKFDLVEGRRLEKELISFFDRNGSKSFFNYLLIDPRISLSRGRPSSVTALETKFDPKMFSAFIKAIFYVGKGHGKRSLMHLYEAAFQARARSSGQTKNKKCQRIIDIWQEDYGVISLHCFLCISSAEALARECLMLETLGLANLTNIQTGQNKMRLLRWNESKRRQAGAFLLYKAYWIYCIEGHNQIRLTDVHF